MKNFWQKLNNSATGGQAIYALAPMAGVTDSAFRQVCKSFGADVVYSEMASATALAYNPIKTLKMLEFSKRERPYLVQLFGSQPDYFAKAVLLIARKLKPDGLDINFGCPVKKVAKQGAGAVLMNNLKLAKEIIKSVINNTDLPVSIKTRSQVGEVNVLKFLDYVSDLDIKAVMIHGRTMSQGFSGEVNWQTIKKARNYFGGVILANGGVANLDQARELLAKTGADGVGIARGALGRPWIFQELKLGREIKLNDQGIFSIALKQARLARKLKPRQGLIEMRKHLCWYVRGHKNACQLRQALVKAETIGEIKRILK